MNASPLRKIIGFILTVVFLIATKGAYGADNKKLLHLSEKEVLKEVLSASHFIRKIKTEKQKNLSRLLEIKYSFSSWKTFSNWTHSKRNNPQIFIFESQKKKTNNWELGLEKSLPYGLSVKSVYSHQSEKKILSDFLKSTKSPNQIYRKNLSLGGSANLNEALAQHWSLKAVQKGKKANEWLYYEKAEELALKSAGQYWKTYFAWMTDIQTKESLKTYRKLVRQINNKKKYNFLNPGERPQILAEYENLKQSADKQEQNYNNEKKALLVFLNKDPEQYEIQFTESKLIPVSDFPKIKIENTRIIKIKNKQIAEQEFQLRGQRVQLFPNLHLSSQGGWIPGSTSADNLSFSRKQSFYEMGLSLNWNIFSKSAYEKVNQTRYQLEESKIDLSVLKQELKNKISSLEKEISIHWTNIHRAKKSNNYRKRAFKELKKSFEQGRVDVFELINTENKLRESEIRKQEVRGEYSMSVLQLLALRDQLVEPYLQP